ncbi:hypothetical protein HPB50_020633 [Hyalomma asiaticum]|uniref:Uncharacterized protein n=1 Tax=Hyalomma asiaticum TaxID=266040 RepID=A0ACB7S7M2_HYAAI|nr:hypothetical protein HPB50_020633 [Hyalomma asiaticum]
MAKRPLHWVRCSVPGCNKGASQREQGRCLSVFRVPRDATAREVWERRLELTPGSQHKSAPLCFFRHASSTRSSSIATVVRIPRGRAALLPNALPLAPHSEELPNPKGKEVTPTDEGVCKLSTLNVPSKYWSCIRCRNFEGAVYVTSSFYPATTGLVNEKVLVVQWAPGDRQEAVMCETFVRGRRLGDAIVGDLCAIQRALCVVDTLQLCAGVGSIVYVLEQLGGRLTAHLEHSLVVYGDTYFSHACVATVEASGTCTF